MIKVLIATTNLGKFAEFFAEFEDLNFKFFNLRDLKLDKIKVDEPFATTQENALHKARFFAQKSGLPTIAEDTAFGVDYLNGEPGVTAKRFGATAQERNQKILKALKGVPKNKRGALFQTTAVFYDPKKDFTAIFKGLVKGQITAKITGEHQEGMGYDAIFYYPPLKKTFAQLPMLEKNRVSQRGQAVNQLKYFLSRHYRLVQLMVSGALVVKDRRMLLTMRRDHRPIFDKKWEFPGGVVDGFESTVDCLKREVEEETGYKVEPLEQLKGIYGATKGEKQGNYRVFVVVYVAKIKSGRFQTADAETRGHGWFTIKQALKKDLLPLNKKCLRDNLTMLKKYIDY